MAQILEIHGATFDGGGSTLTATTKKYVRIPYRMWLTGWTALADQSGSVAFDILRSSYSGFPTTSSIKGSATVALSSQQSNTGTTSGWTAAQLNAEDVLEFQITGTPTSCTWATLLLNGYRN